ncbi:MAG: enoyl-CoA hydratase-related protein [Nocardioidaceae bacterium]
MRNAFRPHTVDELLRVLEHARISSDVGCVLLTGNGPSPQGRRVGVLLRRRPAHPGPDGLPVRRRVGRRSDGGDDPADRARLGRLHILECQRLIRFMPKVVICVVPGWAAGGGHSLHVVARPDAGRRPSTRGSSRPTPTSASFDGGFGSAYLARQVGQKFAREIFFLGEEYAADGRASGWAWSTRSSRTPSSRRPRWSGAGKVNAQVADGAADAEVLLQPDRRRPGRPAALRRRGDPAGLHDRRGRRGTRRVPRRSVSPDWSAVPLVLLNRRITAGQTRYAGPLQSAHSPQESQSISGGTFVCGDRPSETMRL